MSQTIPPITNKKTFLRSFLMIALFMSCSLMLILAALPFIVDTPPVKRLILDTLSQISETTIKAEGFQIEFFPQPRVEMQNITLAEPGSGKQLGTIQKLDLEFQFLPLISQSIVVTQSTIVKPVFFIAVDPQENSTRKKEGSAFPSSKPPRWHIQSLQISDGEVTIIQPAVQGQTKILTWSDIDLTIHSGIATLPMHIQLSLAQTNKGPKNFLLTGTLDSTISGLAHMMSMEHQENRSLQFLGQLDMTTLTLRPIFEFVYSEALPPDWSATGELHTPIDIVFDGTKWSTTFSNMEGQINDLHIQGKGFVNRETDSQSGMFFQGSTSPISIKALQGLVLPSWISSNLHATLLDHQVEGNLEVLTATIAGTLEDKEPLSVIGALRISDGQGHVHSQLPPVKNFSALAVLGPHDHLTISEVLADYGSSKLRSPKIQIAFHRAIPEYTADVQIAWVAPDVLNTIISVPNPHALWTPFLPIEEVRGEGKLDIHLKGPLTDFSLDHIQKAESITHHVGFRSQALPLAINNWSGVIHWHQHELSVQKLAGSIGNSQVEFSGIFSNPDAPQLRNGKFQAETDMTDISTLYPEFLRTAETVSGKMAIVANISGPLSTPTYDGKIDFQNLTLAFPSLLQKPLGAPAWLEFSGAGKTPGTFVANSISLNLPPFALGGKGQISTENGLTFEGTFQSQSVNVSSRPSGVVLGGSGFSPDHLDVSLDIQGSSSDWTQWQMTGFLAASERALPATAEPRTPKEMTIQAKLQDEIVTTNFRTDGIPTEAILKTFGNESPPLHGKFSLQGTLDIPTRDQHLATDTSTGNVTFLISKGHVNHVPAVSKILGILNLPSLLMGKINFLDDGMPFEQISGTLSLQHGIVNSDDLLMDSPVMKLSAAGNYNLSKDDLNVVVAASPFGAYSKLLKSTPLFGQILEGERQGLTTALFKVTGPMQDPNVQYQPLDSLAGGVKGIGQLAVDVLTNFINIPKRALGSTEKQSGLEQAPVKSNSTSNNSDTQSD